MYIKLNFTTGQTFLSVLRVVTDIINTGSITSISTLRSRASGNYAASLLSALNDASSEIVRTNTLSTTKAHISSNNPSTGVYSFTIEQSIFDDPSKKIYYRFYNTTSTSDYCYIIVYTALTSGSMANAMMPLNTLATATTAQGTAPTHGGTSSPVLSVHGGTGLTKVKTLYMHINDNSMMFAVSETVTANGWPTTYSNSSSFNGPFIFSQYTRDDILNTPANILPVVFSSPRGAGVGLGCNFGSNSGDFGNSNFGNPLYTGSDTTTSALRVLNLINNTPSASTDVPTTYTIQNVALTVDGYSVAQRPLGNALSSVANYATSWPLVLGTSSVMKVPDATITTPVYALYDLGWEMSVYNCFGGSISEISNIYLYNGPYSPGDELSIGSTTYVLMPTWAGYTNNIALAIPKE